MAVYRYIQRFDGVGSGLPCILGTGIRADVVASRFVAGDSIRELSEDYNVSEAAILDAIRLVASTAFGRRGLLIAAETRMCIQIPLRFRETT